MVKCCVLRNAKRPVRMRFFEENALKPNLVSSVACHFSYCAKKVCPVNFREMPLDKLSKCDPGASFGKAQYPYLSAQHTKTDF